MTEFESELEPATTLKVGAVLVSAIPPIVALMEFAVPAVAPVKVAEYVPSPLSVTALNDPVEVPPLAVNRAV